MAHEFTVTGGEFGFILRNWDTIGFLMIGIAIIAIIVAILSKDRVGMKILNVFFITFIPLVGSAFFFGRLLYIKLRDRKQISESPVNL